MCNCDDKAAHGAQHRPGSSCDFDCSQIDVALLQPRRDWDHSRLDEAFDSFSAALCVQGLLHGPSSEVASLFNAQLNKVLSLSHAANTCALDLFENASGDCAGPWDNASAQLRRLE